MCKKIIIRERMIKEDNKAKPRTIKTTNRGIGRRVKRMEGRMRKR